MKTWLIKHGVPWYVFNPGIWDSRKFNRPFFVNIWIITGWKWAAKMHQRTIK